MTRQANPALIGGFVVGALVLVVAGILIFTDSRLFTKFRPFVIYFQGTVNGLSIGAPVKLKGVQIGQVTGIQVELNLEKAVVRTPVVIELDLSAITVENKRDSSALSRMSHDWLIQQGLRAQLMSQSLLTGKLYIEMNFYPGTPVNLVGANAKFPEIPTLPSESDEIINGVGDLIAQISKLPLDEFFSSLVRTTKGLEKLVNSPKTVEHLEQIGDILTTLKAIAVKMNTQLGPLVSELTTTVADTRILVNTVNDQVLILSRRTDKTLAQAERSMTAMENLTGENSTLTVELSATLEELSDAAHSMRVLADYLQRNPDAILFGKRDYSEE